MRRAITKKEKYISNLILHYNRALAAGELKEDEAQRDIVQKLDILRAQLEYAESTSLSNIGNFLKRAVKLKSPRSLYIWGNVGRGKSMLMDMFFEHVPVERKRRVHFHAFMQEVHARLHQLRQRNEGDPVSLLARDIASETSLLCFDELQATDVADATLLYRLFSQLFDAGIIIVSTSNHPPASLYTGGIQRERFSKFITLIEERMSVASLSSPTDYRHQQIKSLDKRYVTPLGLSADNFITETIARLSAGAPPEVGRIHVLGRVLTFPLYSGSIGRFSFAQLCENPLGPADYLEIAKRCDTMLLENIPQLSPEKRNEAKRFVTLIDALYEHKVKLLATAATAPDQLYPEGDGNFEFKRTISRLAEMQSAGWGL
ncbi:MAG: cell division protein ZapE [Rickettsiales bacterium]|nr:cell division protein ZapE [Rickettsiales bacterium]